MDGNVQFSNVANVRRVFTYQYLENIIVFFQNAYIEAYLLWQKPIGYSLMRHFIYVYQIIIKRIIV